MKTWITFEMQDYFANQTELLSYISWEYVRSWKDEIYKANIKHLFPWDSEQAKLINPWSYLAWIVYDWLASYIWEPTENQNINYIDLYEGLLTTWYLRFFQNVDTKQLESIKPNYYFYDKNNLKETFINIYEVSEDNHFLSKIKYYLLVETFEKWLFERKLFLLNSLWNLSEADLVPLDTLEFLKWKAEKLTITWIDRLIIEKQVERPILEKIKTIIVSIEKKLSEIEKNFLDYTEQFKVFRNLEIPDDCYITLSNWIKRVDFDKLWKIVQTNNLNWTTGWLEIVKNTNDLLIQSIDFIDKQIRQIASITWIPLFAFWLEQTNWNDSGTSKIKSAWMFYKKIERYRGIITKLFYDFWETFQISKENQILEFWEITTSDPKEIIENEKIKIEIWVQSKKRAIMKINNTDEAEAQKILQEIAEENKTNQINVWVV